MIRCWQILFVIVSLLRIHFTACEDGWAPFNPANETITQFKQRVETVIARNRQNRQKQSEQNEIIWQNTIERRNPPKDPVVFESKHENPFAIEHHH
jgi:hypothetical protein